MAPPYASASAGLRKKATAALAATGSAVLLIGLAPTIAGAHPSAPPLPASNAKAPGSSVTATPDPDDFYDSRRDDPAAKQALRVRREKQERTPSPGVRKLRKDLGKQGLVDIDPLTGTPRNVAKLDGFLTGPSGAAPKSIALSYVNAHPDVFRLTKAEVAGLTLRKDYVDVGGTHHLSFVPSVDGVPVFGNDLKANVTKKGQLVNVTGSVAPGTAKANLGATKVDGAKARELSATSVKAKAAPAAATKAGGPAQRTRYSNGDQTSQVVFVTPDGSRRAWQTYVWMPGNKLFLHVIDAETGKVLYRQTQSEHDSAEVFDNYPGAPKGGKAVRRELKPTWLPKNSPHLAGNVGHVYADMNDNNKSDKGEEIPPSKPGSFDYPLKPFKVAGSPCDKFVCTWDPTKAGSWKDNLNQGGAQVMYFLGKFHDHLNASPIGFTRSAGNFEAVDGDGVQAEVFDGAATANGNNPDPNHTDNANFGTPPDGQAPRMQMYLFKDPADPSDPFLPVFGGNESDIIYHEYTHGLSNRLVVDASGNSTLGPVQAGSMGEAWSDWYAMDFLTNEKMFTDTKAPGELLVGAYVSHGENLIRTQPIDCPVGSTSPKCPGVANTGPGGYTFGDFGRISRRGAEVHADGEIWAQTLWDLRTAIGTKKAESLVTRAMELSPANPSFLDMRNSIIQADMIANNGGTAAKIWQTFATRGMGFFASVLNGDDAKPVEDFTLPPRPGTPTGTILGTVTDQDTKKPAAGVTVSIGGHNSGFPGDYSGVTDAAGKYKIANVYAGTYPAVIAGGSGYDAVVKTGVSVPSHDLTIDWTVRRDWAASAGGAKVVSYTGPDLSDSGCGPGGLYDQSLGTGWGSVTTPLVGGKPAAQNNVVKLPKAVAVTEVAIDPNATCGDDKTAATKDYKVETSKDGKAWVLAASGAFADADRGRLNKVTLAPAATAGVQFVRFTMVTPQVPGDFTSTCAQKPTPSGCAFVDASEMAVYGTAG